MWMSGVRFKAGNGHVVVVKLVLGNRVKVG